MYGFATSSGLWLTVESGFGVQTLRVCASSVHPIVRLPVEFAVPTVAKFAG